MRILVVDDEEDLCEILQFNLESEGFEVTTAHSAEEALELLRTPQLVPFDLILLDVMMERMSGFEMADSMRTSGDNTPIIFLTARDAHDDQLQGFGLGADDYIVKPFSFDTVLARIRAVLRRSAQPSSTAESCKIGDQYITLVPGLTKRETLIYKLLSETPGRYFSRDEILSAVWPDDTCVGERSVDVHITRLRKKLAVHGIKITNKSGFGYGLV